MKLDIFAAVAFLALIGARLYVGEPKSTAVGLAWLGAALLVGAVLIGLQRKGKRGKYDGERN